MFLLCAFLSAAFLSYAQNDILYNKDIMDMVELGFSEEIIIAKIRSSRNVFDTSVTALKALKDHKVPDSVITALLESGDAAVTDERTGIYYVAGPDSLVKILPAVFSGTRTDATAAMLVSDLINTKIKSVISGASSGNRVRSGVPEFLFFFKPGELKDEFSGGANNWWFYSAASPNEFVLVKLTVKKGRREIVTGKANSLSSVTGIDEKKSVGFRIEQIDPFLFKVIPDTPLREGEYGFFYKGIIPQGDVNQSVFDFSVGTE